MTRTELVRHVAFVARCSGSATLAYMLAGALGVPHPVWAAMTAILVVSQESLGETRTAVAWRVAGTIIGIWVAIIVVAAAPLVGAGPTAEIAVSVAICAVIARRYPPVRVCMWTSPIIFLIVDPNVPAFMVGIYRAAEVILGGLVGAAVHTVIEAVTGRLAAKPAGDTAPS